MKPLSLLFLAYRTICHLICQCIPSPIVDVCGRVSGLIKNSCEYLSSHSKSICKYFRFIFLRIFGPIFVILACFLLTSAKVAFLLVFLNELSYGRYDLYLLHLIIGIYFYINIMFNYMLCVFTSPGYPPKVSTLVSTQYTIINGQKMMKFPRRLDIAPCVSYRYCSQCECIKPPRAHHDSISGQCVLEMDHFCPWMNNCVGYGNYRYFVLFLFYLWFATLYVQGICVHSLYSNNIQRIEIVGWDYGSLVVFLLTLAFAAMLSVGVLLILHIYLIYTNQTTLELYINYDEYYEQKKVGNHYRNPYDHGWKKNLIRVFGDVTWYSMIGLSTRTPPSPDYPISIVEYLDEYHGV